MIEEEKEEKLNDFVPPETILKIQFKKNRILQFKLGQSESYIQELENTNKVLLSKIDKLNKDIDNLKLKTKELNKEVKQEEMYKKLNDRLSKTKERERKLMITRDKLIERCNHFEKLLIKNNITYEND